MICDGLRASARSEAPWRHGREYGPLILDSREPDVLRCQVGACCIPSMSERAEVAAKPLVLLTANHESILLVVIGVHKPKQPVAGPSTRTTERLPAHVITANWSASSPATSSTLERQKRALLRPRQVRRPLLICAKWPPTGSSFRPFSASGGLEGPSVDARTDRGRLSQLPPALREGQIAASVSAHCALTRQPSGWSARRQHTGDPPRTRTISVHNYTRLIRCHLAVVC